VMAVNENTNLELNCNADAVSSVVSYRWVKGSLLLGISVF